MKFSKSSVRVIVLRDGKEEYRLYENTSTLTAQRRFAGEALGVWLRE